MSIDISISVSGQAGQGMQVIAFTLAKIFTRCGYSTFTYQDVMSRIRGGNNSAIVRVKDAPVYAMSGHFDILVALDKDAVKNMDLLKDNGIMIYDGEKIKIENGGPKYFSIPLEKIALEQGKDKIMSNIVGSGAVLAFLGWDLAEAEQLIKESFEKKGAEMVENNKKALKAGFDFVKQYYKGRKIGDLKALQSPKKRMLITGSESIATSALSSGLKFYSGYPMSPSTTIMEYVALNAKTYGVVFEQAEDEIAAMNMVIGAGFAGARSMTGTSGGGFSLMVEGLSLAGITETPIVVVIAQRPGPATGFPTRTEQAELKYAINAGHGEFPRAVFAPRTPADCVYLTSRAFNLAEKYQTPVIILTDQLLSDSYYSVEAEEMKQEPINRNILTEFKGGKYEYKRYALTPDGISPRIIPGLKDQVSIADSDEHTEEGHITESAEIRNKMVEKRAQKMKGLSSEISQPIYEGDASPDVLLVGWGSTYGAVKEAMEAMQAEGIKTGMMHFIEVFPLPKLSKDISKVKEIYCIENNSTGQFADLFEYHTGVKLKARILKYDGRPFTASYIMDRI